MKVIEILKLNKGMLKTCRKVGIRMEDVQYIELYNDYNRLLDEGEKGFLHRGSTGRTL